MDQTPAQPTPPAGQQPPQVIYVQNQPVKSRRLRNVAIACVVGVAGLGLLGKSCGVPEPWNGSPNYGGPTISAPATTTPTPVPPLSHIAPKVQTSGDIGVHSVGNQSWIDVAVNLKNMGDRPVQNLTISLQQNGAALTIVDSGGWDAVPNGAQFGSPLGIAASQPVVLRVEQWQPNVPITIVVSGNGVLNDVTQATVACPTTTMSDGVACAQVGSRPGEGAPREGTAPEGGTLREG